MLWDAITKDNEHNLKVILSANFPIDLPLNTLGVTSLHLAAGSSHLNILNIILQFGPNVNI
jgi:ankyrin repeat protein